MPFLPVNIRSVGIITYDHPHLKTNQVIEGLLRLKKGRSFRMFALPFQPRKPRHCILNHRPDQSNAVHPRLIAQHHGLPYFLCNTDMEIDSQCDIYLVLGSGILSPECVAGKKLINCHPGIIPAVRGLDAFKWAIHDMKPLGVTLHFIDAEVDAGQIIAVVPTSVYASDTLDALARRHYENEIDVLIRFEEFCCCQTNPHAGLAQEAPRRRMPVTLEHELAARFEEYKARYAGGGGAVDEAPPRH